MGLEVGLVTSFHEDFSIEPLEGIRIYNYKSDKTTTFRNVYTSSGREQCLLKRAESLGMEHIPEEWITTIIIHLGAVPKEINPETGFNFPDANVCISLQGWLREWDENGTIQPSPFPVIKNPFPENTSAS
jgi:hypothetical protein